MEAPAPDASYAWEEARAASRRASSLAEENDELRRDVDLLIRKVENLHTRIQKLEKGKK